MNTDAIEINGTGIKCDAAGCDYEERVEIGPHLIGRPCPKCGANLLTQEDYDAGMMVLDLIESLHMKSTGSGMQPPEHRQKRRDGIFWRLVATLPRPTRTFIAKRLLTWSGRLLVAAQKCAPWIFGRSE